MAEGVAESDTNIMPVGRVDNYPALDKGYGGVYTYPIYTSSPRLFTQLTRLVLRKRVGLSRCVGQHPRMYARRARNSRAK